MMEAFPLQVGPIISPIHGFMILKFIIVMTLLCHLQIQHITPTQF